jgi:hypothetical protein
MIATLGNNIVRRVPTPDVHHGTFVRVSSVKFEPEYINLLKRGHELGYLLPSYQQQIKQNKLLRTLKQQNIWNQLDVFWVFATNGNNDFATLNWKLPTSNRCTRVSSPTFTANSGYDFDGSSSYLNSNWNPSTQATFFTRNDCSFGCHINEDLQEAGRSMGSTDSGGNGSFIVVRTATNRINVRINALTATNASNTNAIGFYQGVRDGASSEFVFKNGVQIDTDTTPSTVAPGNRNFYIGCNNANGTANQFTTKTISMAFAGASMKALAYPFYQAWNEYFSNITSQ